MKTSVKLLISIAWLFVYNIMALLLHGANSTPQNQAVHYTLLAITYLPMLLALLVWFNQPKTLYKAIISKS